VTLATRVTDT